MHTFRFNPVYEQWVLLGVPIPESTNLQINQFLDVGKKDGFVAANYPKSVFVVDPAQVKKMVSGVHADQAPVGEYELLLYGGDKDLFSWNTKEWVGWLNLVQQRILQIHHNVHLHNISITLATKNLDTVEHFQRVGEIIATSHPLSTTPELFDVELRQKIKEKELLFTVMCGTHGFLQVPTAPLFEQELWFLPSGSQSGVERTSHDLKEELGYVLSETFKWLHLEHPKTHYILKLHTSLSEAAHSATWWLQIHKDGEQSGLVRTLPEIWMREIQLGGLA